MVLGIDDISPRDGSFCLWANVLRPNSLGCFQYQLLTARFIFFILKLIYSLSKNKVEINHIQWSLFQKPETSLLCLDICKNHFVIIFGHLMTGPLWLLLLRSFKSRSWIEGLNLPTVSSWPPAVCVFLITLCVAYVPWPLKCIMASKEAISILLCLWLLPWR